MRCVVAFVLALALMASPLSVSAQEHEEAPKSAALAIDGKSHAPLQLMLRTTYFYDIGVDPPSGAPTTTLPPEASRQEPPSLGHEAAQTPQTEHQGKRNGRAIGIGVGVTVAVVLAVGVGVGVSVSKIKHMEFF
jgi:hypothetical protein